MIILLLYILSLCFPNISGGHDNTTNVVQGIAAVPVELFTGELLKKLRFMGTWAEKLPNESKWVGNNVIHLNDIGADPTVLINNTIYPIASSSRVDTDISISLSKYDTTNTLITDDELYAISYDKMASVVDQHKLALEQQMRQHGLWTLAVAAADATKKNFVLGTTGATVNGRKRLTLQDLADAKTQLDNALIPLEGRSLVLCNEHINDIIGFDQAFRDRFYNTTTGQVINYLGFNIFQDVYNPVYTAGGVKKAFGAAAAGGDRNASTIFWNERCFRALGETRMYYRIATLDPENRQSAAGFRVYNIISAKKNEGFGVIASSPSA